MGGYKSEKKVYLGSVLAKKMLGLDLDFFPTFVCPIQNTENIGSFIVFMYCFWWLNYIIFYVWSIQIHMKLNLASLGTINIAHN